MNQGHFNNILFNGGAKRGGSAGVTDDLIFNGFGLQNEHFITQTINAWNMPSISLLTYNNPKSDGGGLLDRYFKERTINVQGVIKGDSYDDTQERIDALKKALSVKQGYLDMKIGETYRRILCSLTNSDIITRKSYDIEHGTYNLTFKALDPFWSERTRSTELFENVNMEINEDIFNEGSEYSNPIINIVVNLAENTDNLFVKIGENAITINEEIKTNDIIEINTATKEVLLNGASTDFVGRFPRLEAGVNTLTLNSNGNYKYEIAVLYPKNFL